MRALRYVCSAFALLTLTLATAVWAGPPVFPVPADTSGLNLRFKNAPKVCFAGDSIYDFTTTENVTNGLTTTEYWTNYAVPSWLRRFAGGRMYTDPTLVFAVAATKTDHFLATQVPAMIAAKCQIVIGESGTNDIGIYTVTQSVANMKAGIALLNAAGIAYVHQSTLPQGVWNNAKVQQAAEYNRQMYLLSLDPTRQVRYVDVNPAFVDYSTGNAISGYQTGDLVHVQIPGAYAIAQKIWPTLDQLLPQGNDLDLLTANDTFDATLSPNGNMLANGMLTGTGGFIAPGGATGQGPTSWTVGFASSTASTETLAISKTTDGALTNLPLTVFTFGGTGDSNYGKMDQTDALPAGVNVGDKLVLRCQVSWSGLTNFKAVQVRLTATDGASNSFDYQDGANGLVAGTYDTGVLPSAVTRYPLMTAPMQVTTGMTTVRIRLEMYPKSGASISGTVSVDRCSLRKAQ